jgi:hypothetical protein
MDRRAVWATTTPGEEMRKILLGILEPLFHYPYMRFYVTARFQTIAAT